MSGQDIIRTVAPPPEWLQKAWTSAKRSGLDTITLDEIDAEISASRREKEIRPWPTSSPDDIYDEATRQRGIEQAKALRDQTRAGGLRFEVYLPGSLAEWLLDQIERGVFIDPSEAVFVMLMEQRDLEPHTDLREEILRRSCQAAIDDPRRISHEEVVEKMRALTTATRPEPARWRRQP